MTLRYCLFSLGLLFGTGALAHDGDHSGMTATTVQLHHLALPIVIAAITSVALIVIIASYRKRAAQLATDDGANCR